MERISYRSGAAVDELCASLAEHGIAYVVGVGDPEAMLSLAERFGVITEPGVGMPSKSHDGQVYSVEMRNCQGPLVDRHGGLIVSSTNHMFPLHTDGYNRDRPPRYVLLLRTDTTSESALSYVSDSWQVAIDMETEVKRMLYDARFPTAAGPMPLLTPHPRGLPAIRFNEQEIARWSGRDANPPLDVEAQQAVSVLAHALATHQKSFVIESGDCLILDNSRFCHGRSALSRASERVLKRVWVD